MRARKSGPHGRNGWRTDRARDEGSPVRLREFARELAAVYGLAAVGEMAGLAEDAARQFARGTGASDPVAEEAFARLYRRFLRRSG